MNCPFCGNANSDEAVFCSQCGKKLHEQDNFDFTYTQRYDLSHDTSHVDEKEITLNTFGEDGANDKISTKRNSFEDRKETDTTFDDTNTGISKVSIAILSVIVVVTIIIFIISLFVSKKSPPSKKPSTTADATESSTEEYEDTEYEIEPNEDSFDDSTESTESDSPAMIAAREGLHYAEDIVPLEYGGHVYAIFNFKDLGLETFDECQEFCRKMGGHLAVIDSEDENEEIYNYLLDNDRDHTFFGFTDQNHEGVWEWVDYSDVVYTNWSNGQPNNRKGIENYAQFDGKNGGTWNDASFGSQSWRFLCEWE